MASPTRTVKVKFDGDAKGVAAATKDAERELDKFSKQSGQKFKAAGDASAKSYGASMRKWFRGDGSNLFQQLGKSGGTVFGSGLLGALKTPILGPAILAAVGGAALTVLPAAGAIAGAGFVTGAGLGLAGLGLVFAARSERVKKTWSDALGRMGADMTILARPFEATLIGMAGVAERTFGRFKPALEKAFSDAAPAVGDFVDQVGRGLEQLIPVLDPITTAMTRVLEKLGPAVDRALGDVAAGMTELANSVAKNPEALADMVDGLGNVTREGLNLLTSLNNMNSRFSDLTGGVSLTDVVFKGLVATVRTIKAPFDLAASSITALNILLGRTHTDSDTAGASMSEAANSVVKLAQAQGKAGTAGAAAAAGTKSSADAAAAAAQKAAAAKTAYDGYIAALFRLQNMALGVSGAQINLQAAVDAATASVKENGRTLDINTEKGRANRSALNDVASSANAQTQAMLDAGKGNDAAGLAAERARGNFVRQATQMGLSQGQAKALAAQLIAIPNVSRTAKLTAQKQDLDTKLADARRQLRDPNLSATKRAKLEATISQLLAAKQRAQAAIDSLRGKTVSINVNTYQRMIPIAPNQSKGVLAPGRASGGLVQPRRQYLVGERGPEILTMPGVGGRITSNERTSAAAPSAEPTYLEAHIEIGGEVVRVVRTELKQRDRDLKRNVKAGN